MNNVSWSSVRKSGIEIIFSLYISSTFVLLLLFGMSFKSIHHYSAIWAVALLTFLLIKSSYTFLFEVQKVHPICFDPQNKYDWFLKYINFCDYISFVAVNIIYHVNGDTTIPENIEKMITLITIFYNVIAIVNIIFMIIVKIVECYGYNVRIKDLLCDILSFEFFTIFMILFIGMLKAKKSDALLMEKNGSNYDSTHENDIHILLIND